MLLFNYAPILINSRTLKLDKKLNINPLEVKWEAISNNVIRKFNRL